MLRPCVIWEALDVCTVMNTPPGTTTQCAHMPNLQPIPNPVWNNRWLCKKNCAGAIWCLPEQSDVSFRGKETCLFQTRNHTKGCWKQTLGSSRVLHCPFKNLTVLAILLQTIVQLKGPPQSFYNSNSPQQTVSLHWHKFCRMFVADKGIVLVKLTPWTPWNTYWLITLAWLDDLTP